MGASRHGPQALRSGPRPRADHGGERIGGCVPGRAQGPGPGAGRDAAALRGVPAAQMKMPTLRRRDFLQAAAMALPVVARAQPPAPKPQAKRAIFVVLDGGLSQIDSFDPKPALVKHAGKPLSEVLKGATATGVLRPSPWPSRPRGAGAVEVTDLFPGLSEVI